MQIVVKKEIYTQGIEWFQCSKETMNYLKKHGYKTVEDVIDNQSKLPKKYWVELKRLLGFDYLGIKTS